MKGRMLLAASAVTFFVFCQDIQAQNSAPAKESTATLEKTLSWLGRHFETKFTYGYSTIEASADTATANHYESVVNRVPVQFEDCNISWRDRDDVVRVPLSDIDPLSAVALLHSEPNVKFDSELWKLALLTRDRKKSVTVQQTSGGIQARNSVILLYDDRENANKFARALQHAVKLCWEQVPFGRN